MRFQPIRGTIKAPDEPTRIGGKMTRTIGYLAAIALALSGCDSGGDASSGSAAVSDPSNTLAMAGESCVTTLDCAGNLVCFEQACTNPTQVGSGTTITPTGECGLDMEKMGKEIGDLVGNFALPDQDGQTYELYDTCKNDKKAVWVVLAAGW